MVARLDTVPGGSPAVQVVVGIRLPVEVVLLRLRLPNPPVLCVAKIGLWWAGLVGSRGCAGDVDTAAAPDRMADVFPVRVTEVRGRVRRRKRVGKGAVVDSSWSSHSCGRVAQSLGTGQ